MIFNSQPCTSKEQSNRLIDLGVKIETADMYHYVTSNGTGISTMDDDFLSHMDTPAWSLDRLIELLKDVEMDDSYKVSFFVNINRYDEIIALIQSFIHINKFNKEYLNK